MSIGIALAFLATLGWGIGDVLARRATLNIAPKLVALATALLATCAVGTVATVTVGLSAFWGRPAHFYLLVATMGLFSWVSGQMFYIMGMARAGVRISSPIVGAVPVVSVSLAIAFGGERPSLTTVAGAVIVVGGIALVLTDRKRAIQ